MDHSSNRSDATLSALGRLGFFAFAFTLAIAIGLTGPAGTTASVSRAVAQTADVEVRSSGGLLLRRRQYGHGARWVILVHHQGQDSRAWRGPSRQPSPQGVPARPL